MVYLVFLLAWPLGSWLHHPYAGLMFYIIFQCTLQTYNTQNNILYNSYAQDKHDGFTHWNKIITNWELTGLGMHIQLTKAVGNWTILWTIFQLYTTQNGFGRGVFLYCRAGFLSLLIFCSFCTPCSWFSSSTVNMMIVCLSASAP